MHYRLMAAGCLLAALFLAACSQPEIAAPPAAETNGAAAAPVADFFERVERERRAGHPQALSVALMGTGRETQYLGRLDVPSVEGTRRELSLARRHLEELERLRARLDGHLDHQNRLSLDIMEWTLRQRVDGAAYLWHDFPVNQLIAIHNQLPSFMINAHPVRNDRDVDFYIERLEQFPAAFRGTVAVVEARADRGILPPRVAVETTLRDIRAYTDVPASESPLVVEYLRRVEDAPGISHERRTGLEAELATAVAEHAYPGFDILESYLADLLERADSNGGVWRLPDGGAYYRWIVRGHTTTDMTPEDFHRLGLEEVERIEGEMHAILCDEGYCRGTVGRRMAALAREPRFLYPDTDAGRERILDDYRDRVAEAGEGLEGWFHAGPTAGVEVRRIPEFREDSAFGAYYSRPAVDGTRPGVFYVNLRAVDEMPRFGMRTLAHHETIPGHHLQITRQQAMENVPDFRRGLSLHAFSEGWALYAEYLTSEMGLHATPYEELGRLQGELFRAVRLVVDTGLHRYRWSRQKAIDYMRGTTGMGETEVEAEIDRYLVFPGQACSFKAGMMRIQALRARARSELGEAFDIRDFHALILDNGAMPLAILEEQVQRWIARGGGPSALGTAEQ